MANTFFFLKYISDSLDFFSFGVLLCEIYKQNTEKSFSLRALATTGSLSVTCSYSTEQLPIRQYWFTLNKIETYFEPLVISSSIRMKKKKHTGI